MIVFRGGRGGGRKGRSRKQSSTKWTTHFEFRGRILCLLTRVYRRESLVLQKCRNILVKSSPFWLFFVQREIVTNRHITLYIPTYSSNHHPLRLRSFPRPPHERVGLFRISRSLFSLSSPRSFRRTGAASRVVKEERILYT